MKYLDDIIKISFTISIRCRYMQLNKSKSIHSKNASAFHNMHFKSTKMYKHSQTIHRFSFNIYGMASA